MSARSRDSSKRSPRRTRPDASGPRPTAAAARAADVVVLIVPVMLDDEQQPDYRYMDAAVAAVAPGVHAGSLVIFETTLPVGDTRGRYAPVLAAASGLTVEDDLFVAFSPERLLSGPSSRTSPPIPSSSAGSGRPRPPAPAAFYASVLDAEVVAMSNAEAAEFAKLAETTYRDVNIALANEFARYADRVGVDILEVIAAANSQPYSHIHQPGIGVGGHCIPVYPHFLLSRAPEMTLVDASRKRNDGQVDRAIESVAGARRPRRRRGAGAGPDLSGRRQGAGLLAGAPADRRAAGARGAGPGLRPPAVGRESPAGRTPWARGAGRPSGRDRDPDRRPGVCHPGPARGSKLEVSPDGRTH